jgi:F420-non-reducing hydrogenase iron-sulfur subunit
MAMATNSQNKVHNLDLDMNGANQMSEWEPNIVSFLCNWCSYGAADLAGVSRMQYPANIRVVRIPCTGRMSPKFALAALRQGADGVWVSG